MSDTRQALDSLAAGVKALGKVIDLQQPPASRKMLRELNAVDAPEAAPREAILEALRLRLLASVRRSGSVATLDRRDLRDSCWLLWDHKAPLVDLADLLSTVLEQATRRSATRRNLINAWIMHFRPGAPRLADVGSRIVDLTRDDPRLMMWAEAQRSVSLFDPLVGPRRLAERILADTSPVNDVLEEFGFSDPMRGSGGYMRAVQSEVLALAGAALMDRHASQHFTRIKDFLVPEWGVRFKEPAALGEMARGLLSPWVGAHRHPPGNVATEVQRLLLTHVRDPRVKPENWREAGEDATKVMLRWLAGASLRTFFELIGKYALDHQFRYREAFWSAYLDRHAIDDAWLALGAQVYSSAKSLQNLRGDYGFLRGASKQQAVLLLKIGNTIFCEWSHNGSLRAWPLGSYGVPKMGRREYDASELSAQCLAFPPSATTGKGGEPTGKGLPHHGSKFGTWQGSAARLIADRGGPRLFSKDWMPR